MDVTIWKHQLNKNNIGQSQSVAVPTSSTFLSVGEQSGLLMLWSMHKTNKKTQLRNVIVAYTGQAFKLPTGYKLIGTVQISGLVYHVFVK